MMAPLNKQHINNDNLFLNYNIKFVIIFYYMFYLKDIYLFKHLHVHLTYVSMLLYQVNLLFYQSKQNYLYKLCLMMQVLQQILQHYKNQHLNLSLLHLKFYLFLYNYIIAFYMIINLFVYPIETQSPAAIPFIKLTNSLVLEAFPKVSNP